MARSWQFSLDHGKCREKSTYIKATIHIKANLLATSCNCNCIMTTIHFHGKILEKVVVQIIPKLDLIFMVKYGVGFWVKTLVRSKKM